MNTDIKAEWVAELRSGKFPQGARYLLADERYCCLGVLCEIALRHDVPLEVRKVRQSGALADVEVVTSFDGLESALPSVVSQWADVSEFGNAPAYTNDSLAWRNDNGESFEQIADYIEENM